MSEKGDGQLARAPISYRIPDLWTRVQRIFTSDRSLRSVYALVVVLLTGTIGMLLALQGWRSRIPAFDMVDFIDGAHNLLARGILPQYGDVSSYASFTPPGAAWLMAPGMFVFKDPRLFEKVGSGFLHFGTLLGIFVLARACFSTWCACVSVLLYGLSRIGLSFAGSLWAIGHPFFYVWLAYFAVQWVTCRDAKYLAVAMATWTVGMYVDMAIAPAAFVLPTLWLIYRPPLFSKLHLIAAAVTLALWYPYLQFEMERGLADLKSLFLLRNIMPANYKEAWCDPNLTLEHLTSPSMPSSSGSNTLQEAQSKELAVLDRLLRRGSRVVVNFLRRGSRVVVNFNEVAPAPGVGLLLTVLALTSLGVLSVTALVSRVCRFAHQRMVPGSMTAKSSLSHAVIALQERGNKIETELFVLSLVVPWLTLLIVAELDNQGRFFWLWPLQVIVLAAFVTYALPRLKAPRPVAWIGQFGLMVILIGNPLLSHVDSWHRTGWSGPDAAEVDVADYVSEQIRTEGHDRAAIGYHIFIYPFMATYNIINPLYKVGTEFDLWFKYRHGIANTNQCAEGLSSSDEYLIVQTRPQSGPEKPRHYFDLPRDKSFRLLRRFDLYHVFKRD